VAALDPRSVDGIERERGVVVDVLDRLSRTCRSSVAVAGLPSPVLGSRAWMKIPSWSVCLTVLLVTSMMPSASSLNSIAIPIRSRVPESAALPPIVLLRILPTMFDAVVEPAPARIWIAFVSERRIVALSWMSNVTSALSLLEPDREAVIGERARADVGGQRRRPGEDRPDRHRLLFVNVVPDTLSVTPQCTRAACVCAVSWASQSSQCSFSASRVGAYRLSSDTSTACDHDGRLALPCS
jgi:hypothetical protein